MMNKKLVYLFVISAFVIMGVFVVSSATRQGWFMPTQVYVAEFDRGDGIFVGTPVQIAGLAVGDVIEVELNDHNKVVVKMEVRKKFTERIREDSVAILGRPFIIGERLVTITTGSKEKKLLPPGSVLAGQEALEITDMLSGGRLQPYFQTFSKLFGQMSEMIDGDKSKGGFSMIDLYRQAYTSLKSIELLRQDIASIRKDVLGTPETKKLITELAGSSESLRSLITQLDKSMPMIANTGKDVSQMLPEVSKALRETVITLQALQKSFILRGAVAEVKEEQLEQEKAKKRETANEK